eukprot:323569-Pyramimonas_sp.AAC.1
MRACTRAGTRGSVPEALPDTSPGQKSPCEAGGPPWRSSCGHHQRPASTLKPFSSQRALRQLALQRAGT